MKKYLSNGMRMNEQIDRNTGELKSAQVPPVELLSYLC